MKYLTETIEGRIGVNSSNLVVYGKTHKKKETNINRNIVADAIIFGFNRINLSIEQFQLLLYFRIRYEQVVKCLSHIHYRLYSIDLKMNFGSSECLESKMYLIRADM